MLSFTDDNGNPIGPTQQVNLSPGQMASLTFNPNKYTKSGRQEYVPQITPNNPTGGQGVAPACLGSAEVYATKTAVLRPIRPLHLLWARCRRLCRKRGMVEDQIRCSRLYHGLVSGDVQLSELAAAADIVGWRLKFNGSASLL